MANYICLDIGGTKILGALLNSKGELLYKCKKKTQANRGYEQIENNIVDVVNDILEAVDYTIEDISAIAAGAPGIIDQKNGVIKYAPNLPWRNYEIKKNMEQRLGVPFYIENDGNVGTIGEATFGVAVNQKNFISICVGTGVGAGIYVNGELFTGTNFAAAEIGHMCLNIDGPLCNCGQRGCLEAYASKTAITKQIRAKLDLGTKSILRDLLKDKPIIKSKMLKRGLEENDKLTIDVLSEASFYLAAAIGSLINIFNPSMVVLGGGVIEACGDFILKEVKNNIKKFTMSEPLNDCEIVNSKLLDYAIIYGALSMIKE